MKLSFTVLSLCCVLTLGAVAFATTRADDLANVSQEKKEDTGKDAKRDEPKKKDEEPKKDAAMKAVIGKPAPDFSLTDLDGKAVKLSDFKGKTVVLEWFNPSCPFVVAAYKDGPLKDMAARAQKDGIVWLAINSGAPGKEGAGAEANKKARTDWKMTTPILLDEKGEVGRMYDAKTTPHCYVIDAKGVLVYRGGLDNAPQGKFEGDKRIDYLANALAEVKAGKPVTMPETKSWGCSVKYGK
jgi:peroxiredoxin